MQGTAVSPPAQRNDLIRGGDSAAEEACLDHDLLGHVLVAGTKTPRNETLDAVARIFGTRIEGGNIQAEIERCRTRADRLVTAGGSMSTAVAMAYAGDLFVLCENALVGWKCGYTRVPRLHDIDATLIVTSADFAWTFGTHEEWKRRCFYGGPVFAQPEMLPESLM